MSSATLGSAPVGEVAVWGFTVAVGLLSCHWARTLLGIRAEEGTLQSPRCGSTSLRVLAVQDLSATYWADEIASGVTVISHSSVSGVIAGCILKVDVIPLSWTLCLLISLAF